jgi:curli biogenesis system outer membrane secretion channel CsgG
MRIQTHKLFTPTLITLLGLTACATKQTEITPEDGSVTRIEQQEAQAEILAPKRVTLKRKVAIGRFSNETRYGRTFFRDSDLDPLGKQTSDMLATSLIDSQQFLIFERPDLSKIEAEQDITGDSNLIGVDALILGSLTEFGRKTTGDRGFLSSTKLQTARAVVDIRLVDVKTGFAFFSATGSGEANLESGDIAGFGSKAEYDETLNGKAISAAISSVIGELINKLEERPWRTEILQIEGSTLYIAAGERQGIRVGDKFAIMESGKSIKSQSGPLIQLPSKKVGEVKVASTFGESEINEGAVATIVSGPTPASISGLYIAEL